MDFNIIRCARAILHVTDLEVSREFYVDALDLLKQNLVRTNIFTWT